MSSFKMTVKGFCKVTSRDFENGAIKDEIHNALVDREKLLADVTELQAELTAKQEKNKQSGEDCIVRMQEARKQGYIAGLSRFAWWRHGVQYVGSCGTTLKQAIDEGE